MKGDFGQRGDRPDPGARRENGGQVIPAGVAAGMLMNRARRHLVHDPLRDHRPGGGARRGRQAEGERRQAAGRHRHPRRRLRVLVRVLGASRAQAQERVGYPLHAKGA